MVTTVSTTQIQPLIKDLALGAEYLGITVRTMRNLITNRRVPVIHIGRRIYIRVTDLDALAANGTQK